MKKICIFTSTRADFGILKPLVEELLLNRTHFLPELFVTGTHLDSSYGYTFDEINNLAFPIAAKVPLAPSTKHTQNHSIPMANAIIAFEKSLDSIPNYDLAIILGDRFEALAFALVCYNRRIPIAHIHGGEVTYGALDEGYRHSITKLSYLHFPCAQVYADRIIQMGENPSHVFNVGSLALDSIKKLQLYTKSEFELFIGEQIKPSSMLITFHPETRSHDFGLSKLESLIQCLSSKTFTNWTILLTGTNNDHGSRPIRERLEEWRKTDKRIIFKESLGQKGYYSAIALSQLVVGNSSSGILEVPHFKKPTINIGSRQNGRARVPSIIDVTGENSNDIYCKIEEALNLPSNKLDDGFEFYGHGNTSRNICSILSNEFNSEKIFYDLKG